MKRLICKLLRLHELKPLLGLSILDLTPEEQEALLFAMFGPYQLTLFD